MFSIIRNLKQPACRGCNLMHRKLSEPFVTPVTATLPTNHLVLRQQTRSRWTKAKKKRFARFELRKKLEEEGKSLPKPAYYFPRDTPVANALSNTEREAQRTALNEKASTEMKARLEQKEAELAQTPILRHHFGGIQMSERVQKLFDLQNASQMERIKSQKQKVMQIFQYRPGDTGSSAVQIAALSTRIQQMQAHMTKHKKDKHSKRGMEALFSRRRKMLDYLERKDFESYRRVVKALGLAR
ncbi:small subunit ribosomal protein S15 [Fistulifera solaris]|uniref:Small subunit ribosomal protein S15 n=1 Tax=Fistulifera solaris TaxID=1519565 RepID=A0A1Z5J7F7_FISSO|nr:small subunit ribosomal protein S15 [Fistulifera solaris]|eukprot:GAX09910.1 small subunit ribosomal protein S15 [Fistulifera solaris]